MRLTVESIAQARSVMLGITGAFCLAYAGMAIALYPAFAVLIYIFGLHWNAAFAAMGTLTAAAYLLLSLFYERRQG